MANADTCARQADALLDQRVNLTSLEKGAGSAASRTMISPDSKQRNALWALNAILVAARTMAYEKADHECSGVGAPWRLRFMNVST